jgi:hypothetical protein
MIKILQFIRLECKVMDLLEVLNGWGSDIFATGILSTFITQVRNNYVFKRKEIVIKSEFIIIISLYFFLCFFLFVSS